MVHATASATPLTNPIRSYVQNEEQKNWRISENGSTDGTIGGDSVREVAVGYLPPMFVDEMFKVNAVFRMDGIYEYCDELGTYSCKQFSVAYQHRPFGSFRVLLEQNCPQDNLLIGIGKRVVPAGLGPLSKLPGTAVPSFHMPSLRDCSVMDSGDYLSTAIATAFPPPKHSAAIPRCTSRRIIS